nr:MAG TPA: hypothetical protein [Caudoviricetes sp.]
MGIVTEGRLPGLLEPRASGHAGRRAQWRRL